MPNTRIVKSLAGSTGPTGAARTSKYSGVVAGVVTNNQDPEGRGRVKVKFPWLSDEHESFWARVATPLSGNEWGMQFIPEVEDEVVIAFDHGDVEKPVVLGMMYNGKDKPALKNDDGKNDFRQIITRKQHKLIFNDSEDKPSITIETNAGHKILLEDAGGKEKITIKDARGVNLIELDGAGSALKISGTGDITIEATKTLTLKGMDVKIEGTKTVGIQGGTEIAAKAAQVKLN